MQEVHLEWKGRKNLRASFLIDFVLSSPKFPWEMLPCEFSIAFPHSFACLHALLVKTSAFMVLSIFCYLAIFRVLSLFIIKQQEYTQ